MISIRNEVDELERFHKLRTQATDCYVSAIRNSAEYAVELEQDLTEPHRKHLRALADAVAEAPPEFVEESCATLRNLLRDYRDKASRYLNTMRAELSGATRALEEILESLARADGENEVNLRTSLDRLREASKISEVQALRALALGAADAIESSVEEMGKQHNLMVSQFQAEIRVLHHRIDALERAASIDALTELLRRVEIEQRIAQGLPGCCLLIIKTGGFHLAASRFHPDVAAEMAGAFSKRLRNSLPPGSEIGRWSEEGFVAIVHVSKPEAAKTAKWISEHLSGAYVCLLDGKTVRPSLQVSVAVFEGSADMARQTVMRVDDFLSPK
jgi:GGDEF domain-containing protein